MHILSHSVDDKQGWQCMEDVSELWVLFQHCRFISNLRFLVSVQVFALQCACNCSCRFFDSWKVMWVCVMMSVCQFFLDASPPGKKKTLNVGFFLGGYMEAIGNWFFTPSQPRRLYQGDLPKWGRGISDVSHLILLFCISSLVLLPSPAAISVLSFSAFGPFSWSVFP